MSELNEIPLDIIQGQDYDQEFDFLDDTEAVINMTTAYTEAQLHLKVNFDDADPLLTMISTGGTPGIILAATSPNIKLAFKASETKNLTVQRGVYDLLLKTSTGKYERAWQGQWSLNRQVTPNY
jgi:hypothetical protein